MLFTLYRLIETGRGEKLMKMRNTMVAMFFMVIIFLGNVCFAQSAKDAVRALQKLQARIESGISYRDYAPALGDARFEVNLFLQSPQAKSKQNLAVAIKSAMNHYQNAKETWGIKVSTGYDYITIDLQQALADSLFKDYPEIRTGYEFQVDKAVQIIWTKANKELEKAMALLSKS
jgi:hypothetical protein